MLKTKETLMLPCPGRGTIMILKPQINLSDQKKKSAHIINRFLLQDLKVNEVTGMTRFKRFFPVLLTYITARQNITRKRLGAILYSP
jgi:hypothetical protein